MFCVGRMADYRLSAQVISRSSGQSAVAAAAYRAGERLHDVRLGEAHDYRRKSGVLHSQIMAPANTPDWMKDRAQLWNAVEAAEKRKDAQLAREIQLSLPHELDHKARVELARRFVQEQFVDRGMIADLAIHTPGREGDDRNHHAHVMLTMRELTGEGFGMKAREWNGPDVLEGWREQWANHQNREFEKRGLDIRVDHRSYEAQGIDREPTQHLGPTASKMERRGQKSRIGEENRRRISANDNRRDREAEVSRLARQIASEKRRFEAWAQHKREALKSAQQLSSLDLSRNQDRQQARLDGELGKTYGPHKDELKQQAAQLDERLNQRGLRGLLRKITGKEKTDRESRAAIDKTLGNISQREDEQRQALAAKLEREQGRAGQHQQKQAEALERGLERARDRREAEGWKPLKPQPGKEAPQKRAEVRQAPTPHAREKPAQAASVASQRPKIEKAPEQQNERPAFRETGTRGRAGTGRGAQGRGHGRGRGRGSGLER